MYSNVKLRLYTCPLFVKSFAFRDSVQSKTNQLQKPISLFRKSDISWSNSLYEINFKISNFHRSNSLFRNSHTFREAIRSTKQLETFQSFIALITCSEKPKFLQSDARYKLTLNISTFHRLNIWFWRALIFRELN